MMFGYRDDIRTGDQPGEIEFSMWQNMFGKELLKETGKYVDGYRSLSRVIGLFSGSIVKTKERTCWVGIADKSEKSA